MKNLILKFCDKTFWKFILVGILNTLFGMGIMFAFYNLLHLDYWISSASNYFFGSILSYFLNKYFTFQSKETSIKGILKFALNITLCYFVAYGVAKPLVKIIFENLGESARDNLSMLAGSGFFVILNYIGQRFFVFKK